MVTVAARRFARLLIAAQVSASGVHVWAADCCGVSLGDSLVGDTQRGSISPMRILSPGELIWIPADPSPNSTSIRQAVLFGSGSRHRKVGAVISGGKIDPSA